MKYAVVSPVGEVIFIEDETPTLEDFQAAVGGDIQMLTVTQQGYPTIIMYIAEYGKYEDVMVNNFATAMMRGKLLPGDFIVGNVVLIGNADEDGYETSLPAEWVSFLESK